MNKHLFIFVMLSLLPSLANARPGGGAGSVTSGLKDPKSMNGLCSDDAVNSSKPWINKGWCKDIDDTLSGDGGQKGCTIQAKSGMTSGKTSENLSETLRKDDKFIKSLEEACPGTAGKKSKIQEIKDNQVKFNLFLKQLMAVLTIQENEWKPNPVSSMGAKGLMQLSKDSVKAYGKCNASCATLGKTGNFSSEQGNHDTMKCGVTIGLFWMAQDHVMGEGSGNRKARGMARYFQPFRNIDKSNRTWMMGKLKNYCNTRIDQDMPSSGGGYSESNTAK